MARRENFRCMSRVIRATKHLIKQNTTDDNFQLAEEWLDEKKSKLSPQTLHFELVIAPSNTALNFPLNCVRATSLLTDLRFKNRLFLLY